MPEQRQQQTLDWENLKNSSLLVTSMTLMMQTEEALTAFLIHTHLKLMLFSSGDITTLIGTALVPIIVLTTFVCTTLSFIGLFKDDRQLLNVYRWCCTCALLSSFNFFVNFGIHSNLSLLDTTEWIASMSYCALYLLVLHCYLEQHEPQAMIQ